MLRIALAALLIWGSLAPAARAAEPSPRPVPPDFLDSYARTFAYRLGAPSSIRVPADGKSVLFLRSGPRSFVRDLYELDAVGGEERRLLGAEDLLGGAEEVLSPEERARRERMRLAARGIASYELSRDGRLVLVPLGGKMFVLERASGAVREIAPGDAPPLDPRWSPDGRSVAFVRDGELHVVDLADGRVRKLTDGAGGTVTHGLAEFVAQEEMDRDQGYWFSPDSRSLVYERADTAGLETFHIADAAHPERAPDSWPYPRAGRRNADVRLGIVPAQGGETKWIEWDRERYEYLARVTWEAGAPLAILVQNRLQTEQALLAVDGATGKTRPLLVERDPAWLDLYSGMPHWLPGGRGFLWITEREGAPQLERYDAAGERVGPLHGPDLGLQSFEHYLAASNEVVVRASADPTRSELVLLSADPSRPASRRLTAEPGVHSVASEGDAELFVIESSSPDGLASYRLADGRGPRGVTLRTTVEPPGFTPRLEFTEVGTSPSYHAVLVRPTHFDPARRYPVIVHVYGGPTSLMVRREMRRYLLDQWFAERGYVVVSIDGRGTPGRGRDWERAIKGDLVRLPLEDHKRALEALGRKYPELDLTRVGIWGWSFGGYFSAMAVLREPERFHVGVAGAPVVAWEDYDTHYTERYMGLPQDNRAGYDAANVLTYAPSLARPLLLVHGTADDNVYFLHSLKLADALLRAGRPFEFLPLPGLTHMVTDPEVTNRLYERMADLFDEHLILSRRVEAGAPSAE